MTGDCNPPFDVESTTDVSTLFLSLRPRVLLTHIPTDASAWGRIVLARYTSPARSEHPRLRESTVHTYACQACCHGFGEPDIYPSKTSQLEERLNGLVDLLRASGEFPTDGSRTRQSSSSQFEDEPGAYMCSTGPVHSACADLEWH